MKDFFVNDKLKNTFPQFKKNEVDLPPAALMNPNIIVKKISDYYTVALKGVQKNNDIYVKKPLKETFSQVESLKSIVEGFFKNCQPIQKNLKNKTRLYTSISSMEQLKNLDNATKRLKILNEILENLKYNEAFGTERERREITLIYDNNKYKSFDMQQREWKNRVNFK